MTRRFDPHGEALVWSRNCSGCARCRLGPTLMNRSDQGGAGDEERGGQSLDDGEDGELLPGEAGRRSAKEHCPPRCSRGARTS